MRITDNIKLLDEMISEFHNLQPLYSSMKKYYEGTHDIKSLYRRFPNRANNIIVDNFVNKFVNEEVQYALGNPLSYVSLSGNKDVTDAIFNNLFHWNDSHNQELMRTLEIYGKAFILNYIDSKGRFSEKILSPLQGICYCDAENVPQRFIHFYKQKYDESEYRDVYYPNGLIEIYKDNTLIGKKNQPFNGIPVSVCELKAIEDTIYFKIKSLQDGYNQILSDQCNTISDYRNAYLVVTGVEVDEETEKKLDNCGVLNIPGDGSASWLTKNMPDTYIQNMLQNLKDSMYANTNHIDGNEKLQSNTSGTALRNRLIFLEQRCNMMLEIVLNTCYERIERLFEYLTIKGTEYPITDIKIVAKPCIPQDETTIINALNSLGIGKNISLETALSQIPFIESPAQEIEKIKAEISANEQINLDKLTDEGMTDIE